MPVTHQSLENKLAMRTFLISAFVLFNSCPHSCFFVTPLKTLLGEYSQQQPICGIGVEVSDSVFMHEYLQRPLRSLSAEGRPMKCSNIIAGPRVFEGNRTRKLKGVEMAFVLGDQTMHTKQNFPVFYVSEKRKNGNNIQTLID